MPVWKDKNTKLLPVPIVLLRYSHEGNGAYRTVSGHEHQLMHGPWQLFDSCQQCWPITQKIQNKNFFLQTLSSHLFQKVTGVLHMWPSRFPLRSVFSSPVSYACPPWYESIFFSIRILRIGFRWLRTELPEGIWRPPRWKTVLHVISFGRSN